MAKGDYQDRKRKEQQVILDIGEEMGMQKMWDYIQTILVDPDVMSTHALNREILKKVYEKLAVVAKHFNVAFTDNVEADYRQEELDSVLREIWEDEFVVFKDRYPYIKEQSYKKGKKNWR